MRGKARISKTKTNGQDSSDKAIYLILYDEKGKIPRLFGYNFTGYTLLKDRAILSYQKRPLSDSTPLSPSLGNRALSKARHLILHLAGMLAFSAGSSAGTIRKIISKLKLAHRSTF